ncbi:lysophospholipase L1-like esterase [Kibdelosporangium banguiense]|uniref:Lysophospholipase L1-like esterase n=1 Tax=Kibdelosporangium banguiense TaxID=1365924 RepID=A0ABS4TV93_9PSEU|nr:GDSL-type esterase/lipase family protein [Kibdelosporangium banguiense]MBP2328339.1 lysophospholipase L1-like esterase [Kibdelosporangium banguiense]
MRARDRGRALGRILALGAALAVICPAATGVASAQPLARQQQQQQSQQKQVYKIYVVGDSYSSGEGIHTTTQTGRGSFTGPSYFDARDPRHQSKMSAAIQAAARVQAANPDIRVEVHVVAASGATTSDFFEAQRKDSLEGPGSREQNGADPRTWHDKDDLTINSPQLDQIPADADVVIMGFGGNDSYFGPLARTYYNEQAKRPALLQELEQLLDTGKSAADYQREAGDQSIEKGYAPTLVARLLQVMQAIQNRAPNAKILAQNYPLATHPDHTSLYDMLEDEGMGAMRDFAMRINKAIARAVEVCGCAELADVSQAMAGRELNTADPAITSPSTGVGGNAQIWATQEALHPNLKGAGLMADPIAAALAKQLGLKTPPAQKDRPTDTSKIKISRTPAPDTDGDGTADYLDNDWDGDGVRNTKDDNPNVPDAKPGPPQGGRQGTTAPDNRQGGAPATPGPGNQAAPPQNQTPQPPGSNASPAAPPRNQAAPPNTDKPQDQAPPPATGRSTTPPQDQPSPPAADRPTPPSPGRPGQPPAAPPGGGPGQTPPPAQQPAPQQPPTQQPPAPPQNSSGGGKNKQSKAAGPRRGPVIPASTPMRSAAAPSSPAQPSAPRFDPNFGPPGSPKPSQLGGGLAGVKPPAPPTPSTGTGPSTPKPKPPLSGGGKKWPQPKPDGDLSTAPGTEGGGGGSEPSTGGGGTEGGGSSAPSS